MQATIHLRSKDEGAGFTTVVNDRFEKSYHHRNHIYIPSRLDKEQTHGRKAGKSTSNTGRLSSSKTASTTEIHDKSPRHSINSVSKEQSAKTQSTSPSSDKNQQQHTKKRSTSPPTSFDQPIRSLCMFINIEFNFDYFFLL